MPRGRQEFEEEAEPGPIVFGSRSDAPAPQAEPLPQPMSGEPTLTFDPDELPPPPSLKDIKQALKRAEPPPPPERKAKSAAPSPAPAPTPKPAANPPPQASTQPPAVDPLAALDPLLAKSLPPLAPPDEPRVPPHQRGRAQTPVRADHPAMAPLPVVPFDAHKPELQPQVATRARNLRELRDLIIPPHPEPPAASPRAAGAPAAARQPVARPRPSASVPAPPQPVAIAPVADEDEDELVLAPPPPRPPLISVPAAIIIGCLTGVIVGGVIALALLPRNPPAAPPVAVVQAPPTAANAAANAPAPAPARAAPARRARGPVEYARPAATVSEPRLLPLRKVQPTDKVRRLDLDRLSSDIQESEPAR